MKNLPFLLAACLMTQSLCAGETLTNKDGKEIKADVGRIVDGKVSLTVGGKRYSLPLSSLSDDSQKKVHAINTKRINEAGDRREYWALRDELKKKSVNFRGLWLGMTSEEADHLVDQTPLAWKKEIAEIDATRNGGTICFSEHNLTGRELEEAGLLLILAENGQGEPFIWHQVEVSFEKDAAYKIRVESVPQAYDEIKLSLRDWLKAVKLALVQKYGKPATEDDINKEDGSTLRPGFGQPIASWKIGSANVELLIMQDARGYYGAIEFSDAVTDNEVRKRQEKVKGGL